MRLLHTADWHIGKKLFGYDLLAEQAAAFQQLVTIIQEEAVDGVMIAGDLYDRTVPSTEAVALLNKQLIELNMKQKMPLYAISGNHDSRVRLATGSPWFEAQGFHLHTELAQAFQPIETPEAQLFLLPYFEPYHAQRYFEDETLKTLEEAMRRVITQMREQFNPEKKQVLIAHFFAAGSSQTDSETTLTVGGLDRVPTDLLESFDYVALGHLHNRHALDHPTIQYSGTLLRYSTSEIYQQKGVYLVDITADGIERKFIPIDVRPTIKRVTGSFQELMQAGPEHAEAREDYVEVVLEDEEVIPNVMAQLRTVYPKVIHLERKNGLKRGAAKKANEQAMTDLDPAKLFAEYYQMMTEQALSERQAKWLNTSIQEQEEEQK